MKNIFKAFLIFLIPFTIIGQNQPDFNKFFQNKTMRIDYYFTGNAQNYNITLDNIFQTGIWAGNTKSLIDTFNNGHYYIKVYDRKTRELIYSKGFNSIFNEYITSSPAIKGVKKTYHKSALFPYPKREVIFAIEERDEKNILKPLYKLEIDPCDYHIIKEKSYKRAEIMDIMKSGNPEKKVDLVIIAEGYRMDERSKFKSDLERVVKHLFSYKPYSKNKDKFNISGIFAPSDESGVDQPRKGIFKNSVVNSSFNALDLSRYLLTEDNRSIHSLASNVPYDLVCIMVNSNRYGGGGIYNEYAIFTIDNKLSDNVFVHELGHTFAGLADEYYSSAVVYEDFYPKGIEPTEPNITCLLDPENLKWKHLLSPDIKIPTDWGKKEYDKMRSDLRVLYKKMSRDIGILKSKDKSEKKILKLRKKYYKKINKLRKNASNFIKYHSLKNDVGVFEGAGYSSEGIYRPMLNCLMISNVEKQFCIVCQNAIQRMIDYYCKEN